MTYELFLGDPSYSSWSLRGWLLFERFGIAMTPTWVDFLAGSVAEQLQECAPARTVPCLRMSDGAILWDSLAIAEELASRHPDAGIWPSDPEARATARSLAAEMHSGFMALRNDCPMNLRTGYAHGPSSDALLAELRRLEVIWEYAKAQSGSQTPWLFGPFSAADAFFAPVAARIAGYNLPVSDNAQAYVAAHLGDGAFRRWRAIGQSRGTTLPWYERPYPLQAWPGPVPLHAKASTGPSINATCPFSSGPITHFADIDGKIVGFCNSGCRDKVIADPQAWPQVTALL